MTNLNVVESTDSLKWTINVFLSPEFSRRHKSSIIIRNGSVFFPHVYIIVFLIKFLCYFPLTWFFKNELSDLKVMARATHGWNRVRQPGDWCLQNPVALNLLWRPVECEIVELRIHFYFSLIFHWLTLDWPRPPASIDEFDWKEENIDLAYLLCLSALSYHPPTHPQIEGGTLMFAGGRLNDLEWRTTCPSRWPLVCTPFTCPHLHTPHLHRKRFRAASAHLHVVLTLNVGCHRLIPSWHVSTWSVHNLWSHI